MMPSRSFHALSFFSALLAIYLNSSVARADDPPKNEIVSPKDGSSVTVPAGSAKLKVQFKLPANYYFASAKIIYTDSMGNPAESDTTNNKSLVAGTTDTYECELAVPAGTNSVKVKVTSRRKSEKIGVSSFEEKIGVSSFCRGEK